MKVQEKIEMLPVSTLVPYARNARTHSPDQVAQIADSMREFGFTNPVLIDGEGGIVAGHGRVLAARSIGVASVPCLRVDWLTEAQKKAYILADNRLAMNAGWDNAILSEELRDMQADGFHLDLLGFSNDELDAFGGSGSTLMAAERLGMKARLSELSPNYVDVIVRRWQEYTGQRAVHAVTGKPFPD